MKTYSFRKIKTDSGKFRIRLLNRMESTLLVFKPNLFEFYPNIL